MGLAWAWRIVGPCSCSPLQKIVYESGPYWECTSGYERAEWGATWFEGCIVGSHLFAGKLSARYGQCGRTKCSLGCPLGVTRPNFGVHVSVGRSGGCWECRSGSGFGGCGLRVGLWGVFGFWASSAPGTASVAVPNAA